MSLLKKLAGQTALYGLSSMLGRALTFLLVPFYTAILLAADFGVMTELYSHVALLNIIFMLGMETAYFRFTNREGLNENEIFNNAESLLLSTSLFFAGLLILFSQPIANALDYPDKSNYITWLALILATDAIVAIPFAQLRLENKAARFAFIKIFNIVLNISLNVFFLVFCRKVSQGQLLPSLKPIIDNIYVPGNDVAYVFLSNLIANAMLLPIFWKSFSKLKFSIDPAILKPMLVYAYPLIFMGLAGMVNESFSRIILRRALPEGFYPGRSNAEALGIFGACYRLSVVMNLAIQSFRYAAEPFFFSQAPDKNAPDVFSRVMKWFIIACLFLFLMVSLNLDFLGRVTFRNPVYREGLVVVPYLLLANLFLGIYYNLSVWFKLTDRTYFGTFISIGGAVMTIVLNILLIPILGYEGSAMASIACYFLMCLASYALGQKYYPIPYETGNALLHIAVAVCLAVIGFKFNFSNPALEHAFNFLLFALYALFVFVFEKKLLNFNLNKLKR